MDPKKSQLDLDLDLDALTRISLDNMNNINTLPGSVYISNNGTAPLWSDTISVSDLTFNGPSSSATIDLKGEDADILVNGESLMATLRGIQDRLNILRPNVALEAEWDELRELGEQYRKLEAQLQEKTKMWRQLQQPNQTNQE